jgi:uncharacterized protein
MDAMTVMVRTFELHVLSPTSLKEKRRVLKSLIDRLRHRFNVSVAEIGDHDLWQRASIGVACVGHEQRYTQQVIDRVASTIRRNPEVEVLRIDTQVV